MADAPIWVTLVTPFVTAWAGWMTSKLDLLSFGGLKEYEGDWYAYYRDPDEGKVEEELWTFSKLGRVTVKRGGKTTFEGRLVLKGTKAYMHVESVKTRKERLLVMLDPPANPRNGDEKPSICLWLGQDGKRRTTAGHGLISRRSLQRPEIKDEFIRAAV